MDELLHFVSLWLYQVTHTFGNLLYKSPGHHFSKAQTQNLQYLTIYSRPEQNLKPFH